MRILRALDAIVANCTENYLKYLSFNLSINWKIVIRTPFVIAKLEIFNDNVRFGLIMHTVATICSMSTYLSNKYINAQFKTEFAGVRYWHNFRYYFTYVSEKSLISYIITSRIKISWLFANLSRILVGVETMTCTVTKYFPGNIKIHRSMNVQNTFKLNT